MPELLADGGSVPELPGERFVHDHDGRRTLAILPGEVAPGDDRNSNRREPARTQPACDDPRAGHIPRGVRLRDPESFVPKQRERDDRGPSGLLDVGKLPHAILELDEGGLRALHRPRPVVNQLNFGEEHAGRIESGIDALGLQEASREQPAPQQQHGAHADLSHDQDLPEPLPRRAAAAIDFQRIDQLQARRPAGGREPEEQRADQRHAERVGEHPEVERQVQIDSHGQPGRQTRHPRRQREREHEPERSADQRQHGALREQLPHQTAAAGAEREPDGNLLAPRRRAAQQQTRQVGAADQQDERRDDRQETDEDENRRERLEDAAVQPQPTGREYFHRAEPGVGVRVSDAI